ncbi:hypothetical protein PaSha_19155 [Pseudonocardia alni]|nr:hypothetical protein PaSha_19155 [Pseudonocardia alni]
MADEQQSGPGTGQAGRQQVEHAPPVDRVQGRGRLVRDQQVRAAGQGERQLHALALPAGQLAGMPAQDAAGVLDAGRREGLPQGPGPVVTPVGPHRGPQLGPHRHQGIERGAGVLPDGRQPDRAVPPRGRDRAHVGTAQQDAAPQRRDGGEAPEHRGSGQGLAGPRRAEERDPLTRSDPQAHPVDDVATADGDRQRLDREQGGWRSRVRSGVSTSPER